MSFKKYRDIILGAVMLVFSGFYLTVAQGIKTRPKLTPAYASAKIVPILLGVLLAILAVICIIEGVYKMKKYGTTMTNEKAGSAQAAGDAFAVLATFALMIVYALALPASACPQWSTCSCRFRFWLRRRSATSSCLQSLRWCSRCSCSWPSVSACRCCCRAA